jgi:hypothetical protein
MSWGTPLVSPIAEIGAALCIPQPELKIRILNNPTFAPPVLNCINGILKSSGFRPVVSDIPQVFRSADILGVLQAILILNRLIHDSRFNPNPYA